MIDSRTFLEFNTCTVVGAVNVCSSKLVKRRLQAGKLSVVELLSASGQSDTYHQRPVVVFDQCSECTDTIPLDSFLGVLLMTLRTHFTSLRLLRGGFLEFNALYPKLCEAKSNDGKALDKACPTDASPLPGPLTSSSTGDSRLSCPPVAATVSGPAMLMVNPGPTRILAHLWLVRKRTLWMLWVCVSTVLRMSST